MRSRALLGLIALLVSCARPVEPSPSATVDPSLPLFPASPEHLDAIILARLVADGDCLYLESEDGEKLLALWPSPGTEWDGEAVSFGGASLPVGAVAEFRGGGAELNEQVLSSYPWVNPPAEECLVANGWFVYTISPAP